jgi:predicted nucleic acid-binding protein
LTQWAELRQWGRCNRDAWRIGSAAATQRGRARPANDTWIAACALTYGLPLATLNVKDFKDFAEREGLNLIIR